jgi:hypothetical protein
MSKHKNRSRSGRAKLPLVLLGLVACIGGAGYAFAQSGSSSAPPVGPQATAASKGLSIQVAPLTRSVDPGDTVEFTIRIRRARATRKVPSRVRLSVLDGVPAGATASFRPSSTRTSKTTLTVATAAAAGGGYRLRLQARSGIRRANAAVNLVIGSRQSANFAISGDLSRPLEPGLAVPLDLALTNPGPDQISISGLAVSVATITAPRASATYPCTAEDFSVIPFSGAYDFTIPAASTRTLSELGFPDVQLPQIEMPDRPVNQNGCKGSTLQFDFSGTATAGA